jgi:predicted transcriptional regulator YheO
VIHSLENFDNSIVKIVNSHLSCRSVGGPLTDLALRVLRDFLHKGTYQPKTYFTRNKNGRLMKSSTILLFNTAGNPIGMFCINLDLSAPLSDFLSSFLPDSLSHPTETETFGINTNEVIERALEDAIDALDRNPGISVRLRNKTIVIQLYQGGIFDLKGSVKLVANRLELTEHSIYKYIREVQSS